MPTKHSGFRVRTLAPLLKKGIRIAEQKFFLRHGRHAPHLQFDVVPVPIAAKVRSILPDSKCPPTRVACFIPSSSSSLCPIGSWSSGAVIIICRDDSQPIRAFLLPFPLHGNSLLLLRPLLPLAALGLLALLLGGLLGLAGVRRFLRAIAVGRRRRVLPRRDAGGRSDGAVRRRRRVRPVDAGRQLPLVARVPPTLQGPPLHLRSQRHVALAEISGQ